MVILVWYDWKAFMLIYEEAENKNEDYEVGMKIVTLTECICYSHKNQNKHHLIVSGFSWVWFSMKINKIL